MQFTLDQKVKIRASGKIGEVKQIKHELSINHRGKQETTKYLLKLEGGYLHETYFQSELEHVYDFNKDFELGFIDLQMNVNLSLKNYDMCQHLHNQKQKYKKEGK